MLPRQTDIKANVKVSVIPLVTIRTGRPSFLAAFVMASFLQQRNIGNGWRYRGPLNPSYTGLTKIITATRYTLGCTPLTQSQVFPESGRSRYNDCHGPHAWFQVNMNWLMHWSAHPKFIIPSQPLPRTLSWRLQFKCTFDAFWGRGSSESQAHSELRKTCTEPAKVDQLQHGAKLDMGASFYTVCVWNPGSRLCIFCRV